MQRHLLSPHVSLILPNRIHAKGELPFFRIEGRVTAVGLPPVVGWSKYALGQSGYGAFDEHVASLFGYRFRDDKIRASPIFMAIPATTRRKELARGGPGVGGAETPRVCRAQDVAHRVVGDFRGEIRHRDGVGELAAVVVLEAGNESARVGAAERVAQRVVEESLAAEAGRIADEAQLPISIIPEAGCPANIRARAERAIRGAVDVRDPL